MDLSHMDGQTACGIQPPSTSLALEVFGLLMVDEDLEVVKVPLAIIAPRPGESLFDVRVLALCFPHDSVFG